MALVDAADNIGCAEISLITLVAQYFKKYLICGYILFNQPSFSQSCCPDKAA